MAAQGKKEIQRRIRAVRNTQQITRAMKMVAAAKLRRAQEKVVAARPYARQLSEMLGRLTRGEQKLDHPLFRKPEARGGKVALVVITGDRGLSGSYNVNVIRRATAALARNAGRARLVFIGRKGRDHFVRRGHRPLLEFMHIGEEPSFAIAREISEQLRRLYTEGEVDEVRLVFTEFYSALSQRPTELRVLPLEGEPAHAEAEADEESAAAAGQASAAVAGVRAAPVDYIYEPSAERILNELAPRAVDVQVYRALLEAKASEHGARMTAMGNATENAGELIGQLTLAYNRARQASITREISEIVGGAEALK